jgi:hypothetical protein
MHDTGMAFAYGRLALTTSAALRFMQIGQTERRKVDTRIGQRLSRHERDRGYDVVVKERLATLLRLRRWSQRSDRQSAPSRAMHVTTLSGLRLIPH